MTDSGLEHSLERTDAAEVAQDWNQHLRLWLPEPLEAAFRAHQRLHAVLRLRQGVLVLGVLWLVLGVSTGLLLPTAGQQLWAEFAGFVVLGMVALAICVRLPALNDWFPVYAGVAGILGIALPLALTGLLREPGCVQLAQFALIFGVLSLYGLLGLRLSQALLAGWCGGVAGVLLAQLLGGHVNGALCLQVFAASNLLGAFLAYGNDHRSRAFFLQLRQIDQLTREDVLTGLPNRRHGNHALDREWRRALREQRPLAIVLLDIDQFKRYNEALGVEQGDKALCEMADIVSRYARRPGDLAARVGGGEFMLLLPDMLPETANTVAEKLLEDMQTAELWQPPGEPLRVSIGVAVAVPFSDWQPQWLLDAAHRAVRDAKHAGGNAWRHGPFRVTAEPGAVN